jgi:NADP-dependent 3-hydroxy acid dehydrogenase YdfG
LPCKEKSSSFTGASSGLGEATATDLPNSVTEPDIAEGVRKFYEEIAIPAESFAQAVAFTTSQPEQGT